MPQESYAVRRRGGLRKARVAGKARSWSIPSANSRIFSEDSVVRELGSERRSDDVETLVSLSLVLYGSASDRSAGFDSLLFARHAAAPRGLLPAKRPIPRAGKSEVCTNTRIKCISLPVHPPPETRRTERERERVPLRERESARASFPSLQSAKWAICYSESVMHGPDSHRRPHMPRQL